MDPVLDTQAPTEAPPPAQPEGPPPSLTPQQISEFSATFYQQAAPLLRLWHVCTQAVTGWRSSYGMDQTQTSNPAMELAFFNRARDVSFNITQPLYRNVLARLSVDMPSMGVVPATEASDDVQKAQAAEHLARYQWREAKVKKTVMDGIGWAAMHGTTAYLTLMDGDNVRHEAFAPERIRAEPGIGDPNQSRFLAVTRITTKDALKATFPDKADIIDAAQRPQVFSASRGSLLLPEDRVEVLEAYCRSGHWYLIVGAGQVIASGVTPGRCMPLQVVRYTTIPGEFFGMGVVEMCLPAQYAFSNIINQILRNARLTSQPKVMIHRQSKVAPDAFTSATGEKVYYEGIAPSVWAPAALPQYVQALPAQMQSMMFDSAGIHGVSTGKRQVGIVSGRGVEAMQAADSANLISTQDAIEEGVTGIMLCGLLYAKAYYSKDKFIRQFDQFGGTMFRVIKTEQLGEDPDVFLEPGTLFSSEVKDRDAKTLDMLRMGLIDKQQAKKMLSQHLDPMAPIRLVADIEHARKALAALIKHGATVPDGRPTVKFYPTDNFEVFASVFDGYMNSDEFQELQPDRQDAIDAAYGQLLQLMAPPDPNVQEKVPQLPGVPAGKEPAGGDLGGGGANAADPNTTAGQSAMVDAAEGADEHTN